MNCGCLYFEYVWMMFGLSAVFDFIVSRKKKKHDVWMAFSISSHPSGEQLEISQVTAAPGPTACTFLKAQRFVLANGACSLIYYINLY